MARIFFAALILSALFAQIVLLPSINTFRVLPNLPLVLLLVWSSRRGIREGLFWAFGIGLLLDILSLDPLGSNGLAFLVVVLLGALASRRLFSSKVVFLVVLAVFATVLHGMVVSMVRNAEGGATPLSAIIRPLLSQAMLNAILVLPCYWIAGLFGRGDRMVMRHA
jgi:rod shape-determining protein MreD